MLQEEDPWDLCQKEELKERNQKLEVFLEIIHNFLVILQHLRGLKLA